MNPKIKNILSVLAGLVIGSVANMAIIMVSAKLIPPPQGADVTTLEGLKASIHLFKPINFLMPFLAHAIGTLVGAIVATLIAANNKIRFALTIGIAFMIGGIANVITLPAPMWFNILDIVGAYIPMAYLGYKLIEKQNQHTP